MSEVSIPGATAAFGDDYIGEFRRIVETYASTANRFLEWGVGHSTLELIRIIEERGGCELFVTLDDYQPYLEEILKNIPAIPAWLDIILESRDGPKNGDRDPEPAYSTRPLIFGRAFDFIFIDGRRRMECALVAALLSHSNTHVVLHDYRRGRYQLVRALFDIVEDGSQFRVLKARSQLLPDILESASGVIADLRDMNPALVESKLMRPA
jgi:hypothetical protein